MIMKAGHALRLSLFVVFFLGLTFCPFEIQAYSDQKLVPEASRIDKLVASKGEARVIDKLGGEFNSFLDADAKSVVTGLRNGTPITLTTTTPNTTPGGRPATTTTTINPPTGKMALGNVFISLSLAKQQLNRLGIDRPSPEQLQAALLGGSVTTGSGKAATSTDVQAILTMRSKNMGWGQIAKEHGFKLGPVARGLTSAYQGIVVTASPAGNGIAIGSKKSGAVNGSGKLARKSTQGAVRPVGSPGSNRGYGRVAIVNGTDRYLVPSSDRGQGQGRAILTGTGQFVGPLNGITTGLGLNSGVYGRRSGVAGRGRDHQKK